MRTFFFVSSPSPRIFCSFSTCFLHFKMFFSLLNHFVDFNTEKFFPSVPHFCWFCHMCFLHFEMFLSLIHELYAHFIEFFSCTRLSYIFKVVFSFNFTSPKNSACIITLFSGLHLFLARFFSCLFIFLSMCSFFCVYLPDPRLFWESAYFSAESQRVFKIFYHCYTFFLSISSNFTRVNFSPVLHTFIRFLHVFSAF